MGLFRPSQWEIDTLITISRQIARLKGIVLQQGIKLDNIMATQAQLAAQLSAIGDELDKATAEIVAAIQALKDALAAAGGTTPEVDAAVTRLEGGAKSLDDMNPDAVTPPPAA